MKKKILFSLICCTVMQMSSFALAEVIPDIIPQAGTMNTHDLETLKQQQIEQPPIMINNEGEGEIPNQDSNKIPEKK